jgi:hypothetical protein
VGRCDIAVTIPVSVDLSQANSALSAFQTQFAQGATQAGAKGANGLEAELLDALKHISESSRRTATAVEASLLRTEKAGEKAGEKIGDSAEDGFGAAAKAAELYGIAVEKAMEFASAAAERFFSVNEQKLAPSFRQLNDAADGFLRTIGEKGGLNDAISRAAGEFALLTRESDGLATSLGQGLSGAIVAVTEAVKGLSMAWSELNLTEIAKAINPLAGITAAYAAQAKLAADQVKLLAAAELERKKALLAGSYGVLGGIFGSTVAGFQGVAGAVTKKKPEGKGGGTSGPSLEARLAASLDKAQEVEEFLGAAHEHAAEVAAEALANYEIQLGRRNDAAAAAAVQLAEIDASVRDMETAAYQQRIDAMAAFTEIYRQRLQPLADIAGAVFGEIVGNIEAGNKAWASLGPAVRKATGEALKALGKRWGIEALGELAASLSALAWGNLKGAGEHGASAALYTAGAIAAGVGGAALSRNAGSGGGAGSGLGAGGGGNPSLGRGASQSQQPAAPIVLDMRGAVFPTSNLSDAQRFGEAIAQSLGGARAAGLPNSRQLLPDSAGFVR